jgi:glycosyltransferase involved in cell wall biosynthesis
MRRLLILSYFYPPLAGGGVHRVLSFTRHLPAHGWACSVVCAGEHDYWVRDETLLGEVPDGTEVLRVAGGSALAGLLRLGGMGTASGTGGRRSSGAFAALRGLSDWFLLPDSYVGWAGRARAAARARIARGGIDAVLSTSPPDSVHLAAADVARDTHVPWVADFRDPWIGSTFRRPPTPWHAARQAELEARVMANAQLVLVASRTHADQLAARTHARPQQLRYLPNGFEPAPAAPAVADPEHFRIAFTGSLSLMEDAGTLLTAVRGLLEHDPSARARLRVDLAGPYDSEWPARATALGLGDVVRFPGPLAHRESRALQHAADLLLLWKPQGEGFRTMVPGKLYEYLDSGRPVLALLPAGDEAALLVERAGGARLGPGDAAGLARELAARLARWRAGGRVPDSRPEWLATHARARLAGELAQALEDVRAGART